MEEDSLAIIFGKNISRLRRMANMTQLELAEKLNYSDKAISKWEQGYSLPDVRILVQLADLFGVSVDDLVREHSKKHEVIPKNTRLRNRTRVLICSVGLCWLVAVVAFVLCLLIGGQELEWKWLSFLFAVPVSFIVILVFSCVWHWRWLRIISISVIIWTVLTCICFVALVAGAGSTVWYLYLIGIPLQLLVLFYFVWRKGAHFKE